MRTYKDVLKERGVPPGPWCVYEDCTSDRGLKRDSGETADADEGVITADVLCGGLDPKDESPGSASAEIAQTNVVRLKDKRA